MPAPGRWLVFLLMLPATVLPGTASGLVLCYDSGPDAHVAIEWAACCATPPLSAHPVRPSVPKTSGDIECVACVDLQLASEGPRSPVVPQAASATSVLAPAAGTAFLPLFLQDPPPRAVAPAPRAATAAPLVLRI